jgi:hypothetical protein
LPRGKKTVYSDRTPDDDVSFPAQDVDQEEQPEETIERDAKIPKAKLYLLSMINMCI